MKKKFGFTFIEIIIVIVVLGILGAVAAPRLIDLLDDMAATETKNMAISLTEASEANAAARKAKSPKAIVITNCTDVEKTLQNKLPAGYSIKSLVIKGGIKTTCTLIGPKATTATFVGI